MATPIIQSNGTSSGLGTAGQGRNDLVISETVGLSDTEALNSGASYVWAFEDIPIGSSSVLINATTATPSFVPDVTGSYRIRCTVNGTDFDVEVLAVPLPISGGRIPSFEEELEYDEGGNAKGWHYSMTNWMRAMDSGASHPDPHLLSYGTQAAPTYSFSSDSHTGMYGGPGVVAFSASNTLALRIFPTYVLPAVPVHLQGGTVGAPSLTFAVDVGPP